MALFEQQYPPALLVLADGKVFEGQSIGVAGQAVGEVVFNTAMTGYQEVLSDPSYAQQIVTFTYPHIGNVGVNEQDQESRRVWATGMVIRELSPITSNWRASQGLAAYLKQHGVVAIAGIDTRALTHHLRDQGEQAGCIITGNDLVAAQQALAQFPGLEGCDLAQEVSVEQAYRYHLPTDLSGLGGWNQPLRAAQPTRQVVVYDFGVKESILRRLVVHGCAVTVVPARYSIEAVLALKPDGIVLSNGPGDPQACDYAIASTQYWLKQGIPLLGICLGAQLLALASGGKTTKMLFGHHGVNHPVWDRSRQCVTVTSQNHGFMIDADSLPACLDITHHSLFDQSIQGIKHRDAPAIGFQGHPEAGPGPHDMDGLFEQFVEMIRLATEVNDHA